MFDGQSVRALRAARKLVEQIPSEMLREQTDVLDAFVPTPMHVLVRFGQWDTILDEPEPETHLPVARSIRHYARALALAATNRIAEAEKEQSQFLEEITKVPETSMLFQNTSRDILAVAEAMVAGEIAYREIMRRRPESVALMGHSMGALTSMALAKRLQGSGIRVAYMGLIDIPGPGGVVPANVEWAENFYHAFPVFGQLTSGRGYKGFLSNRYVMGQVHITMDKAKLVHNAMISAIWQADAREQSNHLRAYAGEQPADATIDRVEKALATADRRAPATDPYTTAAVTTSDAVPAKPRRKTGSGLPPIE